MLAESASIVHLLTSARIRQPKLCLANNLIETNITYSADYLPFFGIHLIAYHSCICILYYINAHYAVRSLISTAHCRTSRYTVRFSRYNQLYSCFRITTPPHQREITLWFMHYHKSSILFQSPSCVAIKCGTFTVTALL